MSKLFSEWGLAGMAALREEAAVLVIVDVLSFSTAVEVAVSAGASVIPFAFGDEAAAKAKADKLGAQLARPRRADGTPPRTTSVTTATTLVVKPPDGSPGSAKPEMATVCSRTSRICIAPIMQPLARARNHHSRI